MQGTQSENANLSAIYDVNVNMNCCNSSRRQGSTDGGREGGQNTKNHLLQSKKRCSLWKRSESCEYQRTREENSEEVAEGIADIHLA